MDKEPTQTVVRGADAVDILNIQMDVWHPVRDGSALEVMVRSTDRVGVVWVKVNQKWFDDLFDVVGP